MGSNYRDKYWLPATNDAYPGWGDNLDPTYKKIIDELGKHAQGLDLDFYYSSGDIKLKATADFPVRTMMNGFWMDGRFNNPWGKFREITAETAAASKSGGASVLAPSSAYAVFAISGDSDTGFTLTLVPFIRFKSQSTQIITCGKHSDATLDQTYGFTANIFDQSPLLVLTGTDKGKIRTVTANGQGTATTLTYTGTVLTLAQGDYLCLWPSGATVAAKNARYLGSMITDTGGNIRNFVKNGSKIQIDAPIFVATNNQITFQSKDLGGYCSPLAREIRGYLYSTGGQGSGGIYLSLDGVNTCLSIIPSWANSMWYPFQGFFKILLTIYLKTSNTTYTTYAYLTHYFE